MFGIFFNAFQCCSKPQPKVKEAERVAICSANKNFKENIASHTSELSDEPDINEEINKLIKHYVGQSANYLVTNNWFQPQSRSLDTRNFIQYTRADFARLVKCFEALAPQNSDTIIEELGISKNYLRDILVKIISRCNTQHHAHSKDIERISSIVEMKRNLLHLFRMPNMKTYEVEPQKKTLILEIIKEACAIVESQSHTLEGSIKGFHYLGH